MIRRGVRVIEEDKLYKVDCATTIMVLARDEEEAKELAWGSIDYENPKNGVITVEECTKDTRVEQSWIEGYPYSCSNLTDLTVGEHLDKLYVASEEKACAPAYMCDKCGKVLTEKEVAGSETEHTPDGDVILCWCKECCEWV